MPYEASVVVSCFAAAQVDTIFWSGYSSASRDTPNNLELASVVKQGRNRIGWQALGQFRPYSPILPCTRSTIS